MSDVPARGTPEHELWMAAVSVAVSAPLTHGPSTTYALVYWPRMDALRAALDAVGVDWRAVKDAWEAAGRKR
jgi:hypothetical protein